MPVELPSTLSIREILMRITSHSDLTTKGSKLSNSEVDNNFIIVYESFKSIYTESGVNIYVASDVYNEDDLVIENDIVYLSLQDSNSGNTPGVGGSELWWGLCSLGDLIKIIYGKTTKSGITATGTTNADAKKLTKKINRLDNVAAGTGIINASLEIVGDWKEIHNFGANDAKFYPYDGSNFYIVETGAMAADEPIIIPSGTSLKYIAFNEGECTIIY